MERVILSKKPKLPGKVVVKKKKEKFLFLDPKKPDWIVVNSNGALALKLCNGKRTIPDIISTVSKIAKRNLSEEMTDFFHTIYSKTSFLEDSEDNNRNNFVSSTFLKQVHLNLTDNCNMKCIYCYASQRTPPSELLTLEEYQKLVDSLNHIMNGSKPTIVFTGGEPLLTDFALDLAKYIKSRGNQIELLTNGLLINPENVALISELFDLVKVSIDGSTAEIHDFHRGGGTFDKVLRSIELLLEKNAHLLLGVTVTRKNIHDIPYIVEKFGSIVRFAPTFPVGRARKNANLRISGKEYYQALFNSKHVAPLSDLCELLSLAKIRRNYTCAFGGSQLSISPSGDVYPCHLLHLPTFYGGNIRETPFEDIYFNSAILKRCREMNVSTIKGCKNCEIRFICGGACRARAYYEIGTINESGPFCDYEKLAIINGLFELHDFHSQTSSVTSGACP